MYYEIIKKDDGLNIKQTDKKTQYKTFEDVIEYLKKESENG